MSTQASCLALAQQTYDEVAALSTPALPTFAEQLQALHAQIDALNTSAAALQAQVGTLTQHAADLQAKIDTAKAALA